MPAPNGRAPSAERIAARRGDAPFDRRSLAALALEYRGIPYRNGGADPTGFDCSGFTQYVFAQFGVELPREVHDQFSVGTRIRSPQLSIGDLVFFETVGRGASHVAIFLGGGEFVHAPSSNGVVRVERLDSRYWSARFVGARRVAD